jgi:enterobactin synthetase component F
MEKRERLGLPPGIRLDGRKRWPFGSLTESKHLPAGVAPGVIAWNSAFTDRERASSLRYVGDARRFESSALQAMRQSVRKAADSVGASLPLTVAQRGIWIGDKISRDGTVFSISESVEIHGPVDANRFLEALRRVAEEAEATRVNIVEDSHGPRQVIHARYKGELPYVDFSNAADPLAEARRWMMRDVTAKLDLERDALWFSALLKIADDRYFWHHRAHHIIYDGFSGGIVSARVAAIYDALIAGRAPSPTPFSPLRTLVDHETEYRGSGAIARDRAYWTERLADLPEPITLAPGRLPTSNGLARETAHIPPADADRLQILAKSFSCTRPQLLIAAAAAFLARATGARDLVLGMPVSARSKAMRSTPGMAANAVVLRIEVASDATWATLAAETAREVQRALRRQFYRFEDMRRDLGLTGQHQHVTRVAVNIEPFDYDLTIGGAKTTAHNLANSSVEDLVIFVYDRGDGAGLRVDFDANPSLYVPETLSRHKAQFKRIIGALLSQPEGRIADIDILSAEEKAELQRLGAGVSTAPISKTAFEMFEARAAERPGAIAVRCAGDAISYGTLNARANGFARRLIADGIGAGDIVALALPKSIDLVATMIAVHKAGAAFLPIDLDEPRPRREKMAAAARICAVIGVKSEKGSLTQLAPRFIEADDAATAHSAMNVGNDDRRAPLRSGDPAYVIFTSGSTGTPKGAVIAHEGLTNSVSAVVEIMDLGAEDRLISCVAHTFDPFLTDVFGSLSVGATLVLVPKADVKDPALVAEHMRRADATALLATPAHWEALIASRAASFAGLKAAVGGDVLTPRLARSLHDLGARVFNLYGPTEAAVLCAAAPISEGFQSPPPIGRPIRNMRAYVVDAALNLLPRGMSGELCVAGPGVGLGYIHDAAATEAAFTVDPFADDGARLYRTGDIVRWRDDGMLDFVGRKDNQLKIRGHRIEPGEIEAALLDCDGVGAAFVDGASSQNGVRRLIAYVARTPDAAALDTDTLRRALAARLPDYLVPQAFFVLDALPLTPHGKIDRNALPRLEERSSASYTPPRSETERALVDIFQNMLGVERVGVDDNLFELGADSLTAVQLLIEIESRFATELSLLSLFDAPTIANLARHLETRAAADPFAPLIAIRKTGERRPLFCVHSVVGVAWSFAGLLRHIGPRTPLYGLQARGLNRDDGPPPDSIDAMAADYVREMRSVQPKGPYRLLGWSLGGLIAQSMAAQIEAAGENVEFLGLLDAFPFRPAAHLSGERALIGAVLQFLGVNAEELPRAPQTMDELADILFEKFDVFSAPVIAKAGFDAAALRRSFQRVVRNGVAAALAHRPAVVDAPLLVVRAAGETLASLETMVERQTGAWQAYTRGLVDEVDLDCRHFAMLNAEPLDAIGPKIRATLDALDRSDA